MSLLRQFWLLVYPTIPFGFRILVSVAGLSELALSRYSSPFPIHPSCHFTISSFRPSVISYPYFPIIQFLRRVLPSGGRKSGASGLGRIFLIARRMKGILVLVLEFIKGGFLSPSYRKTTTTTTTTTRVEIEALASSWKV